MIQRCFATGLLWVCLTTTAMGLPEGDKRFQSVLAVYHFQDATDSGTKGLDGLLLKDASIVGRGKRGKCLRLKKGGYFGVWGRDKPVNLTEDKFSIVAWVRLPVQPFYFSFEVIGGREKIPVGHILLSIEPSGNLRGVHRDLEALKRTVI